MKEYGDNIVQLELEKQHFQDLLEKKEEILQKYLPGTKSIDILKDINSYIPGTHKKRTPFDDFMIELEEKNILKDLKESSKKIETLEKRIVQYQAPLKKIKGYEKRIYLHILEGMNVTKAVETVAEETGKSDRQIWKYYNKLKSLLEQQNIKLENEIIL